MQKMFLKLGGMLFLMLFVGITGAEAKKNQKQAPVYRLPDDLETLVEDSSLLRKPEGTEIAAYVFPNYHASALHNKIYSPGWTEYNLIRSALRTRDGHCG